MKPLLLLPLLCLGLGGCLPEAAEDYNLFSDVRENSISLQFHNKCLDFIILKFNDRPFENCGEIVADLVSDSKLFVRKVGKSGNGTRVSTQSVACDPINETQLLCKIVLRERKVSDLISAHMEFRLVAEDQRFEIEGAAGPLTENVTTPFLPIAATKVLKEKTPEEEFGAFEGNNPVDAGDFGEFPPAEGNSGGGACSISDDRPTGNIANLWFWILSITGVWSLKKGSVL